MSRDELSASQLAELAALDRIVMREPVEEEHLELAALVDSVRANAPRMDPTFAAALERRIAARRARRRPPRPALARLATAGGGLLAAAVALAIVISSGVLNSASSPTATTTTGHPRLQAPALAPATPTHAPTTATATPSNGTAVPSGAASSRAPTTAPPPSVAPARGRLVHRVSTLTLAAPPAAMAGVANRVVAATEHSGGVVESSNVSIQGSSSQASFVLAVPSGRLPGLIATLSSLASVRALVQNTADITDGYNAQLARLADSVAERAALLKQLATVATSAQATSIQQKIAALAQRIAAEHRAVERLRSAGHSAALDVTVVPGASKHAVALPAGPLTAAYHRALHALEQILAIALIALAIALPFALSALALWWGAGVVRARARERALNV